MVKLTPEVNPIRTVNLSNTPLIEPVGTIHVRMIRTGDLSFCVVTEYADAQTAEEAKGKTGEIRNQAATGPSMTMVYACGGGIFAQG